MNLRKGFFRLAIFVSVIVVSVSFYFFWGFISPVVWYTPPGKEVDNYFTQPIRKLDSNRFANVVFRSLMCGGAVWVIYFLAKFTVEGFVGGKESQK